MSKASDAAPPDGPPPPFVVYYKPVVHLLKLMVILAIVAVLLAVPFLADDVTADGLRMIGVLVLVFLAWAVVTARRYRDRRPQVVVDTDGIFVRDWHVGTVPWENIDFIAHSSSVRRSIVSALTRTRRGPYLLFKFVTPPKVVPSLAPPLSWLQKFWIEMELQEPAVLQYGLDTKVTVLLSAIQDHIAYWQRTRGAGAVERAVVGPDC